MGDKQYLGLDVHANVGRNLRRAGRGDLYLPVCRPVVPAVFRKRALRKHNHDAQGDSVLPEPTLRAAQGEPDALPAGPRLGDIVMSRDPKASAAQLDGTARESVGASVEVAERKPLAEMLRAEGAIFRALVEQQIAGIYIIAADGTLAYVNPYFARVFGYEPADILGRPMLEFVAEPERAAVSERFVAQMTGRERSSTSIRLFCATTARRSRFSSTAMWRLSAANKPRSG